MTKTNQYGQQTTDSGHVLKQREIIAEDIRPLVHKIAMNTTSEEATTAAIAAYVMDYAHTEWSKNVRHGVSLGRSDAVAMLQALLQDHTKGKAVGVPMVDVIELKKVITALEGTA